MACISTHRLTRLRRKSLPPINNRDDGGRRATALCVRLSARNLVLEEAYCGGVLPMYLNRVAPIEMPLHTYWWR